MSRSNRSPQTGWHHLTIVFGALPATVLSMVAIFGVLMGLIALIGGILAAEVGSLILGAVMMLWGSLGICGTLALWAVGINEYPDKKVKAGLALGSIALLPVPAALGIDLSALSGIELVLFVLMMLPLPIAIGWLFVIRRRMMSWTDETGGSTPFAGSESAQ